MALSVALLLAACSMPGRMTAGEYSRAIDEVLKQANDDLYCSNDYEARSDYERAASALDDMARRIDDLRAPTSIAKAHDEWIDTIRSMATHMRSISAHLEEAAPKAKASSSIAKEAAALQADSDRLERIKKTYAGKGIKLKDHDC